MPMPIVVGTRIVFRWSIGADCEQHTHFNFRLHFDAHFRAWRVKTSGEVGSKRFPNLPCVVLDALTHGGDHHAGPVSSLQGERR